MSEDYVRDNSENGEEKNQNQENSMEETRDNTSFDPQGSGEGKEEKAKDAEEFTYSYTKEGLEKHTGNSGEYSFSEKYTDSGSYKGGFESGNNTGAYSYSKDQTSQNFANSNNYAQAAVNENGNAKQKKKKKAREKQASRSGNRALFCTFCILLSVVCGLAGSFGFSKYFSERKNPAKIALSNGDLENGSVAGVADNGAVILYRSVDTVKEGGGNMTVAEIAAAVSNSVVEITTEFVTSNNFFFGNYVTQGAGSGVIISTDGYIVTNNHVIADNDKGNTLADKITVRLADGTEYEADIVGNDPDSDIAVIKIKAEGLSAAVWGDSSKAVVGEQVVAVGNPLGELGGTVTSGIVSAADREVEIDNVKMSLIQIDAAVNPGNSGGGLFNTRGELVGIVNAKSSGTGIEGLGFAIPSNDARDITEQLLKHGYVTGKVFLGVSFYTANSGYFSSSGDEGIVYVAGLEKGYNDDVLKVKDMILSIDGEEITDISDIKTILLKHKPGDKLTFSIIRGREAMDVEVTCYESKPDSSVSFEN